VIGMGQPHDSRTNHRDVEMLRHGKNFHLPDTTAAAMRAA
jgi:hypothetical protein